MKPIKTQTLYAQFYKSTIFPLIHCRIRFFQLFILVIFSLISLLLNNCQSPEPTEIHSNIKSTILLTGTVRDKKGPISGSIVRMQTTSIYTTTNDSGQFILTGPIQ